MYTTCRGLATGLCPWPPQDGALTAWHRALCGRCFPAVLRVSQSCICSNSALHLSKSRTARMYETGVVCCALSTPVDFLCMHRTDPRMPGCVPQERGLLPNACLILVGSCSCTVIACGWCITCTLPLWKHSAPGRLLSAAVTAVTDQLCILHS